MKNFLFSCLILCVAHTSVIAQLTLERDINEEAASAQPSDVVELDGVLYFAADDGINGVELYQYDIASQMASIVANLSLYEESSSPTWITEAGDKIFFSARSEEGNNKVHLWCYTPADMTIARVNPDNGNYIEEASHITVFEGDLFFSAETENGIELVRYSPSTNMVEVFDINPGGESSHPGSFVIAENELWFSAIEEGVDSRLWKYNSASQTIENIVYTSEGGEYPSINFLQYLDGELFFAGWTSTKGNELYRYDIASNTLYAAYDIYNGIANSSPNELTVYNGELYLVAQNLGEGREWRKYNAVTDAVELVEDINIGNGHANAGKAVVINDKLYFTATNTAEERWIYVYDNNTDMVQALATTTVQPNLMNIIGVHNEELLLSAYVPEFGTEIHQYNTAMGGDISLYTDINTTTIGSDPYGFTAYNDRLYFGATEVNTGRDIWVYDPSTGGVEILSDDPANIKPDNFTVADGRLFFTAIHPQEGYGLLYYDDMTDEINTTSFMTPGQTGHIVDVINYNDKLYFKADDSEVGKELFKYDPLTDEVTLVADINIAGDGNPEQFILYNNELYFTATDGALGQELWKFNDQTGEVVLAADIVEGDSDSSPRWFEVYNDKLYFSAFSATDGLELFSYDAATNTIAQRTSVSGSLDAKYLQVYHDKLFFRGRFSSSVNAELLYYDEATDELVLTEDLNPGASDPRDLVVFNDKLYFSTYTNDYGRELWEYNDSTSVIVADIRAGVPSAEPTGTTLFNDKLYFAANDGQKGMELWSIAECINVVVDVTPQYEDVLGAIDLVVTGGTPPYTYSWSIDAEGESVSNVESGEYSVIIQDATGCLEFVEITVPIILDTEDAAIDNTFIISPNPNNGIFSIETTIENIEKIEIINNQGIHCYESRNVATTHPILEVDCSMLPIGVYFLGLHSKGQRAIYQKIIIE